MTIAGNQGQNVYPSPDNYPTSSFPQPVPVPVGDPDDTGTLITVQYSWTWREVLMAAIDQLLNPATWQGDHDEIINAIDRAIILKDLIQTPVAFEGEIDAPYWEDTDGQDSEVELPADAQSWFGYLEGANFVDDLAGWVFVGAVALAFGVDAAIEFATGLKRLRLLLQTGDAGAIVRVIVDGVIANEVDTYSAEPGLVSVDLFPQPAPMMFRAMDVDDPLTIDIVNTGTANPLATPTPDGYMMAVIKKRLWEGELAPTNQRYVPETDQVQYSPDGGTTWYDSPGSDPRRQVLLPPRTGSQVACDSAANVVFFLHAAIDSWVGNLEDIGTTAALLGIVNAAVGILFPPALLITLAGALVDAMFEAGAAAITAAFTETVYDTLKCIIFCRMDNDGALDQERLDLVDADIEEQIGGLAGALLQIMTKYIGFGGLTDAGRMGSEVGDCSECACNWCFNFQDASRLGDWIPHAVGASPATYSAGAWHSAASGDTQWIWVSWTLSPAITLTDAAILAYTTTGRNRLININGNGTFLNGTTIWSNGATVGTPYPATVNRIDVVVGTAHNGTACTLSEMQYSGVGDQPFGDSNC